MEWRQGGGDRRKETEERRERKGEETEGMRERGGEETEERRWRRGEREEERKERGGDRGEESINQSFNNIPGSPGKALLAIPQATQ